MTVAMVCVWVLGLSVKINRILQLQLETHDNRSERERERIWRFLEKPMKFRISDKNTILVAY